MYYEHEFDGVVTAIPVLPVKGDETEVELTALLDQIAERAFALRERARRAAASGTPLQGAEARRCARPWRTATAEVSRRFPFLTRPVSAIRLGSVTRSSTHRRRRRELLRWRPPTYLTERRRRRSTVDRPIEIRVTKVIHPQDE